MTSLDVETTSCVGWDMGHEPVVTTHIFSVYLGLLKIKRFLNKGEGFADDFIATSLQLGSIENSDGLR